MKGWGMIRIMIWIFMIFAVSGIFLERGPAVASEHQGAGLYWWGRVGYECYSSDDCSGVKTLNGYVGLPVDWHPKARCIGSDGKFASWNTERVEVVTGALPPGLRIDANHHIVGVPQRAGTWYLRVQFVGVRCDGGSYGDKTQDLKIKTEGSSAPRRLR